ncbi:MAG TPA: hypothetical protein VGJ86_00140 [Acidimicrobiales bacterium]
MITSNAVGLDEATKPDLIVTDMTVGAQSRSARLLDSWLLPVAAYLTLLAVMVVVSWQVTTHFTSVLKFHISFRGDWLLGGLSHYDGGWYWLISNDGYRGHTPGMQSPVAFFPGYPLAMRYLGSVIGDNALAGIVITALSGLGIAVLFWRWCRDRMGATAAATSLLALLLYPYGFFLYGVIYADALFIFATLLAFWAVERDRPLIAGLAGAVATLTRPVGIAVVLGLAVRTLERRGALKRPGWLGIPTRIQLSAIKLKDGLVLLSISGLVAYCFFLWHKWGDPFLFSSVEKYWDQGAGPDTWFKLAFFDQVHHHADSWWTWGVVIQGLLGLTMLAFVLPVARRFGWGYGVYLLVVVAIPLIGTKDFQGLGRYGMAAFPIFAIIGRYLAERPPALRHVVLACSGLMLVVACAGFARGEYIT